MSLVIEDGSLVDSADSYVTVEEVLEYAEKRALVLSLTTDAHVETLVHRAMDLLEAQETTFQGTRVSAEQPLSWPREGVILNGFDVDPTTIPVALKKALCQLAVDADSRDLMPTSDGREVIEEKVDVISTKYAQTGNASPQPSLTAFFTLLRPLLDTDGGYLLELERVS